VAEFVTADGVPINYCLRGSGPPVYFCHGGPFGSYEVLAADLRPLEADFALVLHDYRGSGHSGTALSDTYDFSHLADDLERPAESSAIRRSTSWPIPWAFGSRSPSRCRIPTP
jgi:pimeloyl-ACP methyl ester carboxylesterase